MPLSDRQIIVWAKDGGIEPFAQQNVNPASIDLRLGNLWIDFEVPDKIIYSDIITLYPRSLRVELHNTLCKWLPLKRKPTALLAITLERIVMPDWLAGEVKLKTTPTRLGLGHPIADWVDPGYEGHLTLMLHALKQITLMEGRKVCQLVLWPGSRVDKPYRIHGHYMNQDKPTLAWTEKR